MKKKHKKMVENEVKKYCERTGQPFTNDLKRRIRRKFKEVRRESGMSYATNHLKEINDASNIKTTVN